MPTESGEHNIVREIELHQCVLLSSEIVIDRETDYLYLFHVISRAKHEQRNERELYRFIVKNEVVPLPQRKISVYYLSD